MENPQDHPLQTLYRLSVMVGTLACGSMAAYHYGPPADELAEMIDSTAAYVGAVDASEVNQLAAGESPSAEFEAAPAFAAASGASSMAPRADGAPKYDPLVQPASALAPVASAPSAAVGTSLDRERLTAPLLAAGAQTADVTPWGRGPRPMYRATASAGVSAGGLQARYDAIGESPEAAVSQVLAQLQASNLR